MLRLLTWIVIAICICAYGALVYGGFTAPVLPYSSNLPYTVGVITHPEDAGSLQQLDNIITFNGYPFFTCNYTGTFTPIYNAPRGKEVDVTYWRSDSSNSTTGRLYDTTIILREPGFRELLQRVSNYLIGGVLLAVGVFFLIFRWPQLRLLVVGCMLGGLLLTSVPDTVLFRAPFNGIYTFSLSLWAIATSIALAHWPVNQLHFRVPRFLVGLIAFFAVASVITSSIGWMGAACLISSTDNLELVRFGRDLWVPTGLLANARIISALGINLLPFPSLMYLLFSAYRNTTNLFIRTQIRTLAWVHSVVWTFQLVLTFIPILFGITDTWSIAPILLTSLSLFEPIAWAVVAYRSTILGVEHFLNRTLFTLLLIFSSVLIMFAAIYVLFSWSPNPDPVLVTVIALVPLLLFNTLLRRSFEKVVDLALYGHYYEYDETVGLLMQSLANAQDIQGIGRVLTRDIPEVLLIKYAAVWTKTAEGDLALVDTWNIAVDLVPTHLTEMELGQDDGTGVIVHPEPLQLNNYDARWYLTVKFRSGTTLEGVLLLGPKLRRSSYSVKDTRVLLSLANWIGGKLSGWRLTEIEVKQEREQLLTLMEHEAGVRSQVAEELHDRGITALSLVRRLVEQQQSPEVVRGALQRVIDDLRVLTSSHLKPNGLDYGLISGLDSLIRDYELVGADITLDSTIPESSPVWNTLSDRQNREVFYVVREAVTNAFKADDKARIVIQVVDAEGCLHLCVQDTGPGFNTDEALANKVLHHGLSIMKARARNISATLTIESKVGVGTSVKIALPLPVEIQLASDILPK